MARHAPEGPCILLLYSTPTSPTHRYFVATHPLQAPHRHASPTYSQAMPPASHSPREPCTRAQAIDATALLASATRLRVALTTFTRRPHTAVAPARAHPHAPEPTQPPRSRAHPPPTLRSPTSRAPEPNLTRCHPTPPSQLRRPLRPLLTCPSRSRHQLTAAQAAPCP